MHPSHEPLALAVLAHYPCLAPHAPPQPLGNHGGFSGARLWRVEAVGGPICLRAWPKEVDATRVTFLHQLLEHARHAALPFVPRLYRSFEQLTMVSHGGRLWEAADWLPGSADYRTRPTPCRLSAACTALAQLHCAWAPIARSEGVPPCVRRRRAVVHEWETSVCSGWRALEGAARDDPVRPVAERAWHLLPPHIARVEGQLHQWSESTLPLQPCHGDPWHDNLLFADEQLTGLVDYSAARVDHPAVDVARMLGSLAGGDAVGWEAGLASYRAAWSFSRDDEALARALDRTGPAVAAANWLLRLYRDQRGFADRTAVARRLEDVLQRLG